MRVEVVRVAVETAGVMEEARVAAARVGRGGGGGEGSSAWRSCRWSPKLPRASTSIGCASALASQPACRSKRRPLAWCRPVRWRGTRSVSGGRTWLLQEVRDVGWPGAGQDVIHAARGASAVSHA